LFESAHLPRVINNLTALFRKIRSLQATDDFPIAMSLGLARVAAPPVRTAPARLAATRPAGSAAASPQSESLIDRGAASMIPMKLKDIPALLVTHQVSRQGQAGRPASSPSAADPWERDEPLPSWQPGPFGERVAALWPIRCRVHSLLSPSSGPASRLA
jgi:hypothetical protein